MTAINYMYIKHGICMPMHGMSVNDCHNMHTTYTLEIHQYNYNTDLRVLLIHLFFPFGVQVPSRHFSWSKNEKEYDRQSKRLMVELSTSLRMISFH